MYWYIINTQYNILCCTPVCFLSENSMSVSKHMMSNIVNFPIVNDVNLQYDVYSQQYLTNQRFVIDFIIKLLTISTSSQVSHSCAAHTRFISA